MKDLEKELSWVEDNFYLEPPHTVHFNITYRCKRRCLYCNNYAMVKQRYGSFRSANQVELGLNIIKRIMNEANEVGVKLFNISGGEPFLRNDVYEVIRHGVSLGMSIFPITKYAFTTEEAERLYDTGLRSICVSFDSFEDHTNRKLHGSSTIKRELLQSVDYLLRSGIEPVIAPVINTLNYKEYENLVQRFKKLGINLFAPMVIAETLLVTKQGLEPVKKSLQLSRRMRKNLREELTRIHGKYEVEEGGPFIPRKVEMACPAADHVHINPEGSLMYCASTPDLHFGSLKRKPLMEVWRSKRRRELMRPPRNKFRRAKCFDCEKYDFCNKLGRCYYEFMLRPPFYRPEEKRLCRKFLI